MTTRENSNSTTRLSRAAEELAAVLRECHRRIVFAESCTGGLIAATLTGIPGISEFLCGSAVVYRNATKTHWLRVSPADLDDESIGPVSVQVASAMAQGVLEETPEADAALSVTGHIGPDAPPDLDGIVYVGLAQRCTSDAAVRVVAVDRIALTAEAASALLSRRLRQSEAAAEVLERAATFVRSLSNRAGSTSVPKR